MRNYPTVAEMPNRKRRKAVRGQIFYENSIELRERRKARRAARKPK